MACQWLRLWHDMPNDPKFRTVARFSGEDISLVLSVYVHLLVSASQSVTRGHVDVTTEDLASALNVTEEKINSVLVTMEGRLIDDGYLSGWDARQPKKEDPGNSEGPAQTAAERKRAERKRKKEAALKAKEGGEPEQCHDKSRDVTTDKDKNKDKDKDKDKNIKTKKPCPDSVETISDELEKPGDDLPIEKPEPKDLAVKPEKPKQKSCAADVISLFDHWILVMGKDPGKTKLTPNRKKTVTARLKDGYSPEDIAKAIQGCAASAFHMGENKSNAVYDDLSLICRSGEHIEGFVKRMENPPSLASNLNNAAGGRSSRDLSLDEELNNFNWMTLQSPYEVGSVSDQ